MHTHTYFKIGLFIMLLLSKLILGQTLNSPESVVYDDVNNRYLVSNTGNGDVIAVSEDGTLDYFNQGASESIRGITIVDDRLYAAGDEGLLCFELTTGNVVFTVAIQEGEFLNDIAADGDGMLYISDDNDLYKVNPALQTYTLYLSTLSGSNGLLYDAVNNKMIVTQEDPARLSTIDLSDGSVTDIVTTPAQWLDGLARDRQGRIYFTSWETFNVYRYDPDFAESAEIFSSGFSGPADLFCDWDNDVLAIPDMSSNELVLIEMPFINLINPNGGEVWQTGTTQQIAWESREIENVKIEYSVDGSKSYTTISEGTPAQNGSLDWIIPEMPSGNCLLRITAIEDPLLVDESDAIFAIETATGVDVVLEPLQYKLCQNYPNPFNPQTTIEFDVKEKCHVVLKIFDIQGREVMTLVDEQREAGLYQTTFQKGNLASGTYFYQIRMKDFVKVRKMMLLE